MSLHKHKIFPFVTAPMTTSSVQPIRCMGYYGIISSINFPSFLTDGAVQSSRRCSNGGHTWVDSSHPKLTGIPNQFKCTISDSHYFQSLNYMSLLFGFFEIETIDFIFIIKILGSLRYCLQWPLTRTFYLLELSRATN